MSYRRECGAGAPRSQGRSARCSSACTALGESRRVFTRFVTLVAASVTECLRTKLNHGNLYGRSEGGARFSETAWVSGRIRTCRARSSRPTSNQGKSKLRRRCADSIFLWEATADAGAGGLGRTSAKPNRRSRRRCRSDRARDRQRCLGRRAAAIESPRVRPSRRARRE